MDYSKAMFALLVKYITLLEVFSFEITHLVFSGLISMACILISYCSCIFRSDIHGMYPNKLLTSCIFRSDIHGMYPNKLLFLYFQV